jgi:hypothetical protein
MNRCEQTRTELMHALVQLAHLRPEWRLGQLISNLATTAGRTDSGCVWNLEDEEALEAARTLIEQYSQAEPLTAQSNAKP